MLKDFYHLHLQFQNFMLGKGYKVRKRESLISPIFPTTFTMSGGPDLAYKFWQGDKSLSGNQIVNQPCIRHWDIELTGDKKHLSFFNMFVADSINGYSRQEVISHFYEFFVKHLHLDPSRFYASYFSGGNIKGTYFKADEEMKGIWLSLGISPSKIIGFGGVYGMEAFVANTVEPVGGPRAELFYDLRKRPKKIKSAEDFLRLDKEGKVLEFFTHVLYNVAVKVEKVGEENIFHFKKMDKRAIAAGFGPQRILMITEGTNDARDISILKNLRKCLEPVPENLKREITIVTDHIRGIVFLIHDGVTELKGRKNNSRKYLFRKYVKNFKRAFLTLPVERSREDILKCLVNECIDMFSILFPDFENKREFIWDKFMEVYNKYY